MTRWFTGAGGLRLAASAFGPAQGDAVVMLGGLGQTRRSWRRAAERIGASGRLALTIDLRGHGESDWAPDGDYGYRALVADLMHVVTALGRPAVLVGASLGGKVALATAGAGGMTIARALVMVDTAPRTNPTGVRGIVAPLDVPGGFASPDEAAELLARQRGTAVRPDAGQRLAASMRRDAEGRWHWHWDPVVIARDHGLGMVPALAYLEPAAARVTMPVLLCRGALSTVTTDAGTAAFTALVPHAEVETISGAGHMIVGDQNDRFATGLIAFLDRLDAADSA